MIDVFVMYLSIPKHIIFMVIHTKLYTASEILHVHI